MAMTPAAICYRYHRRRRQIATSVNDAGGKLPPVSSTPAANCHRYHRRRRQIATGVNDAGSKFTPGAYLELRISLQIFGKHLSDPHRILRGLGKDDSFKKSEVKHLVILSLVLDTYRSACPPQEKATQEWGNGTWQRESFPDCLLYDIPIYGFLYLNLILYSLGFFILLYYITWRYRKKATLQSSLSYVGNM